MAFQPATSAPLGNFDLDFLPACYRDRKVKRNTHAWRFVVLALFGLMIAATAVYQWRLLRQAEGELAELQTRQLSAVAQTDRLTDLQAQVRSAAAEADLYVYLRHPWPSTQILAALLKPLPERLHLQQLHIARELNARPNAADRTPAKSRAEETTDLAKLPPVVRDLHRLRNEINPRQTVVTLSGLADNEADVHRYLRDLGNNDLFSAVEWGPVERPEGRSGTQTRFSVRLFVRPGYGQPGGPTVEPRAAAVRASVLAGTVNLASGQEVEP